MVRRSVCIVIGLLIIAFTAVLAVWNLSPKYPLEEIDIYSNRKITRDFGVLDTLSLDNMIVTNIQSNKNSWLITFGYLWNGIRKKSTFEVVEYTDADGKSRRYGKDELSVKPGQREYLFVTYSSEPGKISNRSIKEKLGEEVSRYIGDFGDEVVTLDQIKNRLSTGKAIFYNREVRVISMRETRK